MSQYGPKYPCRRPLVGLFLHHLFTYRVSPPLLFPHHFMKATLKSTLMFSLVSLGLAGCSKQEAPSPTPPTEAITSTSSAYLYQYDQVPKNSPIPSGWVIIGDNGSSYRIQFVQGAPYGTRIYNVVTGSPIPNGWVFADSQRSIGTSFINTILCLKGAPFGARVAVLSLGQQLPTGWIRADSQRGIGNSFTDTLLNLKEAPSGAQFDILALNQQLPAGWTVIASRRGVGPTDFINTIRKR